MEIMDGLRWTLDSVHGWLHSEFNADHGCRNYAIPVGYHGKLYSSGQPCMNGKQRREQAVERRQASGTSKLCRQSIGTFWPIIERQEDSSHGHRSTHI